MGKKKSSVRYLRGQKNAQVDHRYTWLVSTRRQSGARWPFLPPLSFSFLVPPSTSCLPHEERWPFLPSLSTALEHYINIIGAAHVPDTRRLSIQAMSIPECLTYIRIMVCAMWISRPVPTRNFQPAIPPLPLCLRVNYLIRRWPFVIAANVVPWLIIIFRQSIIQIFGSPSWLTKLFLILSFQTKIPNGLRLWKVKQYYKTIFYYKYYL